jgi:hypothetical protein
MSRLDLADKSDTVIETRLYDDDDDDIELACREE